jgi:hypothetical protein
VTRAPDLIDPVVGFRDWRVEDGKLASRHLPMLWTERTMRAECFPIGGYEFASELDANPHSAPGVSCSCGIYAWHRPQGEFSMVDVRGVTGIVTLWGTLQTYADGMRAEYARVEALAVYDRWTADKKNSVGGIASALGADLVELERLAEASRDYGQPIPDGMLPRDESAPRRRLKLRIPRRARV